MGQILVQAERLAAAFGHALSWELVDVNRALGRCSRGDLSIQFVVGGPVGSGLRSIATTCSASSNE